MRLKIAIWNIPLWAVLSGLSLFHIALEAQIPVITVRFANPQNDCVTQEYCLDVELRSDITDQELFGMNVRFFYDDDVLEFVDFRDYQEDTAQSLQTRRSFQRASPPAPLCLIFREQLNLSMGPFN
ncbi:MAG: hypothetical protein IPN60_02730 [Saprospiraceae bacterium]|nr:hypothetical protein [Candidatus Opimibacter skivensis]